MNMKTKNKILQIKLKNIFVENKKLLPREQFQMKGKN